MAGYLGNAVYKRLQPDRAQKVAEVGVFDGPTSAWLLARLPKLVLYMVDQWKPYSDSNQPDAMLNADKWVRVRRMAHSRTEFAKDRRIVLNLDSVKAAREIPDGSLDMAFIDANHTLEGVRRDIRAYWPKVKSGGWLAGHDWEKHEPRIYGVVQAVQEFAAETGLPYELDEDATWFVRKP